MKEILDIIAGESTIFGYSMPSAWLIAGALLVLAGVKRSVPLTMIAGMMLLTHYFISTMAGA